MRRNFTQRQRKILALSAGNVCQECGSKLGADFHADHVKPFSKEGKTTIVNGQALCPSCNLRKGAKYEPDKS